MTSVSGEGSQDTYLTNLELLATRGYDGALVDCPNQIQVRATELLEESGIAYIAFVQTILDDNNRTVCPNVILDQYIVGWNTMDWLIKNYKSYMGEIDTSKLGAIDITVSTSVDLSARSDGPRDLFEETFPDGTYFQLDAVGAGGAGTNVITPDVAYTLVTATVSANPQIEYWFVTGCVEFYGVGSARALEDLGRTTENALVCVVGHGVNVVDWESMTPDTPTVNVACLMIPDLLYAAPAVAGIVALIDGRATPENLWLDETPKNYKYGNDYGVWEVENKVVTRQDYAEYIASIEALVLS